RTRHAATARACASSPRRSATVVRLRTAGGTTCGPWGSCTPPTAPRSGAASASRSRRASPMAPADAARPITTALLGCGNSGRHYHLPLLLDDPRFDLRVVATGQGGSAADLALPPGVVRCGGWQQALGHDVELVVVALPHHLHHPVASAALDAGRHVLVEKPLATTLAEADDLLARAEASGRVLAVHHQRRW